MHEMICVSLSADTNDKLLALIARVDGQPAGANELRLDSLAEPPRVEELVAASKKPVIVTCRSRRDGGAFSGSDAERRAILVRAFEAGAAMVDAEAVDIPFLAPHKRDTILIASFHDMYGTPDNLPAKVAELVKLPADWIKFAVTHRRPADSVKVLELIRSCPKPCIGVAMGEGGLMTRVLGPAYGSRVTYGSYATGRETAPGQPTARDLATAYRVDRLTRDTRVYGLLGDPVAQSRGYLLHNRAFDYIDFDGVYIPLRAENAAEFLATIPNAINLHGLSVTIPHKPEALRWTSLRSDGAERIGAANTLTLTPDGWHADNTDLPAVFESIKAVADAQDFHLMGSQALVIGSGGTTRAVGVALTLLGCRVTLAARNLDKAWNIATVMDWEVLDLEDAVRSDWKVVANTTSVGMMPNTERSLFPASAWHKGMLAFDAVHNPPRTRFIRDAEAVGALTVDGVEMFVRQAAEQFRMWTGVEMPRITCLT